MPNIHDSKHMAELLTASVQKQDHILLPKAVNGNTYLQKTLETQCKVSYVPLYTIEELPHSIQDEDYDGVLMTCPLVFSNMQSRQSNVSKWCMQWEKEQNRH